MLLLFYGLAPAMAGDGTEAFFIAPKKLFTGSEASVILYTFSISGDYINPRSVPFEIILSPPNGPERPIAAGETDAEGWMNLPIRVPNSEAAGLRLLIARVQGIDVPLQIPITLVETRMVLIETDKPIYKPGQTIQGRVLLLNNVLQPLPGGVDLDIRDAKKNKIYRRTLSTNEYGVAPFELGLASELNCGDWTLHARSGDALADVTVKVEPYKLPLFRMGVEFDKGCYLTHEPVTGVVRSSYFFGKTVDGEVLAVASRLEGEEWVEYARYTVPMKDGVARFEVSPVGIMPSRCDQGTGVSIDFVVTDSAGHPEKSKQFVPITDAPFNVVLSTRSPSAKPGMPFDVIVETADPTGIPVSRTVNVSMTANDDNGEYVGQLSRAVVTQGGKARLSFMIPQEAEYLVIEAESAEGSYRSTARIYGPVAYSPTQNYLQLSRVGDGPITVGDVGDFVIEATGPGATFYEVVAGGRAVCSGRGGDLLSIEATPAMAPEARLMVYRIFANKEVGTDSLTFPVRASQSADLEVSFDAEKVEPGAPVKLEVSAGVQSMVGVAIVDESVLALSQGRLDLSRIYREVATRFGGPSEGEFQLDFAERPHMMGTLDVLDSVGRGVAITPGAVELSLRFPQGYPFWPGHYATTGSYSLPAPGAAGGLAEVQRVRQFFPETWVWEPMLLTDTAGRATLELTAPDSITNWKMRAVSTSSAGLGLASGDLVVFQDFFVEPDLPYAITRGEEVWLPVAVYNYLDRSQRVLLELEPSEGFEVLGSPSVTVEVEPNSVKGASFPIRATGIGTFPFKLTARGPLKADAVIRPLKVEPEGSPQESVANAILNAGDSRAFDTSFPEGTISGSERLLLTITGNQVAQSINGLGDLCGRPYG